jgi:organic radical activating enzyme
LNCKYCNHFSPVAAEKYVDVGSLEKDFARLSELTNRKIENIDLMGGEPLLHPHITTIIDMARKHFDGQIRIVTNGILLPKMSAEFWKSCNTSKIKIIVSAYPIKIEHTKIKSLAKEHKVHVNVRRQVNNVQTWCRLPKDIHGKQSIVENFKLCLVANFCIFLKDGKLSTCCLPLVAYRFNKYFNANIEITENDCIDIYQTNDIGDIFKFLCQPMPFCRYCKIKEWEVGAAWGPSKRVMSEWFDC